MSIFLSVLLLSIVGILASIAIANWQKGGYRNAWIAFGWGIAAFIVFGVGASLLYYYYIIKPASRSAQEVNIPQPNIVFGDSRLREPLTAGKKPWVDIVLNNTSDVPAEGRFMDVTWKLVPAPFNNQLEYAYQGLGMDFDLAPRQFRGIHFDVTYDFTQAEIDALNKGNGFLYLYGKGDYWNEKTPDIKHPLSFCLVYNKDTPGLLAVCPKGLTLTESAPGNITHPNANTTQTTSSPTSVPAATPLSIADRPYVVVESAMLADMSPKVSTNAFITIVNKGRTPARHIMMSLQIAAKPGVIYWLGFEKDDGRRPVQIAFLAAGDRISVGGAPVDNVTLDTKFLADALEGKESLMIHGQGTYEDMTGTEYGIEYAFGYAPSANGFVADWGGPNRKEKWQDEKGKRKHRKAN